MSFNNNDHLHTWGWGLVSWPEWPSLAAQGLIPARVTEVARGRLSLQGPDGAFFAPEAGPAFLDLPTVGDWVAVTLPGSNDPSDAPPRLHAVAPRRGLLVRAAAGGPCRAQPLVANLDRVFVVMGLDQDFNLRRLERFLALSAAAGVPATVVLSKADLATNLEGQREAVQACAPGLPVVVTSAALGQGLEALAPSLQAGHTLALLGSSGAGKSTLTNALLGEAVQDTGGVRKGDGRGKHTTTSRRLFLLPSGAILVDGPGIREVGLWLPDGELPSGHPFADLDELAEACRFRDCAHGQEPGCALREAEAEGRLDGRRLANFLRLKAEAAARAKRAAHSPMMGSRPMNGRDGVRAMSKASRQFLRNRGR